jgi:hypothetical protein
MMSQEVYEEYFHKLIMIENPYKKWLITLENDCMYLRDADDWWVEAISS